MRSIATTHLQALIAARPSVQRLMEWRCVVEIFMTRDDKFLACFGSGGHVLTAASTHSRLIADTLQDAERLGVTMAMGYLAWIGWPDAIAPHFALPTNYIPNVSTKRSYSPGGNNGGRWGEFVDPRNLAPCPQDVVPDQCLAINVTPDDGVDLLRPEAEGLWARKAGDVSVIYVDSSTPETISVGAGAPTEALRAVRRVRATGTTAEGIVALYSSRK